MKTGEKDMSSTKKNNWLVNLSLIVISIFIAIILAEVVLRIVLPKLQSQFAVTEDDPVLRPDDKLAHVLIPNQAVGHDINGFKNQTVEDSYKVVALGDSHTYGSFDNPDVSWPAYFSNYLNLPVYNMGIWGYGTAQYQALLFKALEFNPQIVIVALYTGNDIFNAYDLVYHYQGWDDYKDPDFVDTVPEDKSALKQTKIPLKSLRDWFRESSVLYQFLGDSTRMWREKVGLAKPRNVGTKDWTVNDPDVSLIYDERPEIRTLFWLGSRLKGVDLDNKNIKEGLRLSKEMISDMQQQVKATNTKLIFVLLPMKEAVYSPLIIDKAQQNEYLSKTIEFEKEIRESIYDFCQEQGIICYDALPYLQSELMKGEHIYRDHWDEHPTELGYQKYAEAILSFIKNKNFIK